MFLALAMACGALTLCMLVWTQVLGQPETDLVQVVGGWGVVGCLIFIPAAVFLRNAGLYVKHAESGYVWVSGAGPAFLASLPEVPEEI
jgi:hypothetical protein